MATIKGNSIMFFTVSGNTKTPLAYCTSVSLDSSLSLNKLITKDSDGDWEDSTPNMKSWKISVDAAYSYTVSGNTNGGYAIQRMYLASQPIQIIIGLKNGTTPSWTLDETVDYFSGTIYIDSFNLTAAGDNQPATFKISGTGTGPLTLVEGV